MRCWAGRRGRDGQRDRDRVGCLGRQHGAAGGVNPWPRDPRRCGSAGPRHRGPASRKARAKRVSCSGPSYAAGHARGSLRLTARARAGSARRDQETVRRTLLTPWRRIPRGYPPVRMEEGLDLYDSPTMRAIRCSAGTNDPNRGGQKRGRRNPRDRDIPPSTYAYVQHGSCTVWLCVEPLGPWRTANATARLTELSWSGRRASAQRPAAKARV